jgi:hypothetical protein
MIVGINFCAILAYGRILDVHFHNAEGVKEARPLCGLIDIVNANFHFRGHTGFITAEECKQYRIAFNEPEPEFRSEMKVFDREIKAVEEKEMVDFMLADSAFIQHFVKSRVEELVYEHYLFLHNTRKVPDVQEPKRIPHMAFATFNGFDNSGLSNITVHKCPSLEESTAQEKGHSAFMELYPDAVLVAREILYGNLSIDLLYKHEGEFVVLECKAKQLNQCKKQAQKRSSVLHQKGIAIKAAFAFAGNTLECVSHVL